MGGTEVDSVLSGLASGLALIVAIGAQNAFVLRQGLTRQHVGAVVTVCAVSDVVLILAGVAGIGVVVERVPWALTAVTWAGVGFLTWYGVRSLWQARRPGALRAEGRGEGSLRRALLGALALTWLNPHVYLDTVVLLGSLSAQHGDTGRWWFAAGACLGSLLWFSGLGYGARASHRLLSTPRAWQVLDVLIGLVMLLIAGRLVWWLLG